MLGCNDVRVVGCGIWLVDIINNELLVGLVEVEGSGWFRVRGRVGV